ncbi:DNA oxidative demethylase ALKBH2-like [Uloborus diversus]|uniref:DNA oxidative demethylase ALKBH2-like n=1 Tax=Uloborus diversus TaxID=327109 RepID=UPI002409345E|nr:DNA oxidative demethylase ALKBH2-like [Uloborus diversus]
MNYSLNANELNVHIIEKFYSASEADDILRELLEIPFEDINVIVYGRSYTPKRKSYAFGDDGVNYRYSGTSNLAHPWTPMMLQMKQDVEAATGKCFNYALVNFYKDGSCAIGMHKDSESSIDKSVGVTTIAFGASRRVTFTRSGYPSQWINSGHGDLYQMMLPTNDLYYHGIRPDRTIKESRVSVSFRYSAPEEQLDPLQSTPDVSPQPEMSALSDPLPQHDSLQQ